MNKKAGVGIALVIILLVVIAAALIIIAVSVDSPVRDYLTGKAISGLGNIISKPYDFSDFSGVEVRGKGNLFITQGKKYSIVIEAEDNVLEQLNVRIEGDRLVIGETKLLFLNIKPIKIFITMPEINELKVSGSGDINGQNKITSKSLGISIGGLGDVNLDLDVGKLNTNLAGSGNINYQGNAREHFFSVSGSGDLYAFELETEKTNINIAGSGDAEVFATQELNIRVTGSGNVFYKGDASVSQSVSGSGDVEKIE